MQASLQEVSPAAPGVHRFEQLDALRGLAAVAVLFAHFTLLFPVTPPAALWLSRTPARVLIDGHPAVIFFFTLSGFVLYLPFDKGTNPSYGTYLIRRTCRIYLPYAVSVFYMIVAVRLGFRAGLPLSGFYSWHSLAFRSALREGATYLTLIPPFRRDLNSATWSIAEEMRVSLVFPLLALFVRRCRWGWVLLVSSVAELCAAGAVVASHHYFPWLTVDYAAVFLVGALTAKYRQQITTLVRGNSCWGLLGAAMLLVTFAPRMTHVLPAWTGEEAGDFLVALSAACLLLSVLEAGPLRSILLTRPLQRFGAISYSFYLLHLPTLFLLASFLWTRVGSVVTLLTALVTATLLAAFSYRFVELPSIKLGRKLTKSRMRFVSRSA